MKKLAITICALFIICYAINVKAENFNIEEQITLSLTDEKPKTSTDEDEDEDEDIQIHSFSIIFPESPIKPNKRN